MGEKLDNAKKAVANKLDVNNDGTVDIQDIIIQAIKIPGIHVKRDTFLKKEFFKNYTEEQINKAIETTPAEAGIAKEEVDKIADDVINFERNCVSGISAALGAPGGAAMIATIPADILQYYGYTLRATQKLLYLYGFPDLKVSEEGLELDSATTNEIILCLGIMNGVAGANNAVKVLAKGLANGVEKRLLRTALTKGTIYPFVKAVTKWFGVRLTKEIFAGFFQKSIPVVGGIIGGGITFLSFKPCCNKLKDALKDTRLSNPEHEDTEEENKLYDEIIDSECVDVADEEKE